MEEKPQTDAVDGTATEEPASTDPMAELRRERDDYYDRLLRKTAEFENYRKRIDRERREQTDQSIVSLLQDVLLIVDDFDRALSTDAGGSSASYRKGVELIHTKVHDLLKKYGV